MKKKYQLHEPRLGQLKNGNRPCNLALLPRCCAKSKGTGKPCGQPAMKGKRVCYYHGGKSPGAPRENKNALKSGYYTKQAVRERKYISEFISLSQEMISTISESCDGKPY
jgi:hypothetical protein